MLRNSQGAGAILATLKTTPSDADGFPTDTSVFRILDLKILDSRILNSGSRFLKTPIPPIVPPFPIRLTNVWTVWYDVETSFD